MKVFNLMLNSINDVKDFVNIVSKYDFDVDLTSGRYVVDAKSIMGIFSLDLSKPIDLNIHTEGNTEDIMAAIKPIPAPIKKQALWSIKRPIPYPIYRINREIHCKTKMRSRFFL